jgi:hypothetical protein
MSLFSIIVDIGARTANIEEGLTRVEQRLSSFASTVKGLGELFVGTKIVEFAEQLTAAAAELDHASKRAGVTVTAFQELSYAAKLSGVDSGQLTTALTQMERSMSLASTGAKKPTEALQALGLTFAQLKDLTPDKQLEVIADRINSLPSAADKARAQMDLFGRSGRELGALMAQGAAGIEQLRKEAEAGGGVMSEETVKNLEEAHKAIERMTISFQTMASTILGTVAPALATLFNKMRDVFSTTPLDLANQKLEHFMNNPALYAALNLMSKAEALASVQGERRGAEAQAYGIGALPESLALGQVTVPGAVGAPGYGPGGDYAERLKQLTGVHPGTLDKITGKTGLDQLMQTWLEQVQSQGDQLYSTYDTTMLKINELLQNHKITVKDATAASAEAWTKYQNSLDSVLPGITTDFEKMKRALPLSDIQVAIKGFTDSMKQAFLQTTQESGSFAHNLLVNILKALEDRAIFNAIEDIGAALSDMLKSAASSGGGGILNQVLGGVVGLFAGSAGVSGWGIGGAAAGGLGSGGTADDILSGITVGPTATSRLAQRPMVFSPTYNIVAPNGDQQLRNALPSLLAQTAQKTKADMLEAFRRSNLPAPRGA